MQKLPDWGGPPRTVWYQANSSWRRSNNAEYYRLWNSLEETVGTAEFPLVIARASAAESFSPAIFAAMCSPDFSIAVGRIARFKPLVAPIVLHIDKDSIALRLRIEWMDDDPPPPPTLQLTELAFFAALARIGTREHIIPVRATAQHLELARRLADLDSDATIAERVSAVLLEYLPSGMATIEAVAEKLIMSKRTLQRKLSSEGTSFQRILKGLRQELSIHSPGI
ncbi:MAG: hypothetical protein GVY14_15700 [Spirochaetes bacterium]|jgi:hypothetical protein|nr:hypothetical protein [Spirochaetota bacterium]